MQERAIEFKVGILVLGALALLAGLILVLGNFSIGKGVNVFVDYTFIGNLHEGAPVKISGIKVGKVEQVRFLGGELDPTTKRRVYVRAKLWIERQSANAVHADAEFFINTQGVLGEQYIEIVPGSPDQPRITPGHTLVGVAPPRADLVVSRLYDFLDGVTKILRDDKETISNLLRTSAKAISTIDSVLLENQQELRKLLINLEGLSGESTQLIHKLNIGLGDPQQLNKTFVNLQRTTDVVAQRIDPLMGKAGRALDAVTNIGGAVGPAQRDKIRQMIDNVVKISDRAYAAVGQAQTIVDRLAKGKGTAGALLSLDEMYEDLKEMVRDLKRNPWKFLWRE